MLLIFDWDGTLSDSTGRIVASVQGAATRLGLRPLVDAEILEVIGLSLPEAVRRLYPELTGADLTRLAQQYADHFLAADQVPSPFYAGVEASLRALKADGHPLAVATGKSRRGLDRVLERLGWRDFFDATRCADETESKPSPLMLQELLRHFNAPAAQSVMVGDTEFDMAMAHAIGMPRIAVSYGAHALARLQAYEPSLCLDHFPDLLDWEPLTGERV